MYSLTLHARPRDSPRLSDFFLTTERLDICKVRYNIAYSVHKVTFLFQLWQSPSRSRLDITTQEQNMTLLSNIRQDAALRNLTIYAQWYDQNSRLTIV